MSFTHRLIRAWQSGDNTAVSAIENVVADQEVNLDIPVPANSTNLHAVVGIDVSQLKSLYLLSDIDLTIETNDSGTPDDTLTLEAGIALLWSAASGLANPLTADVTDLYLTGGATAGTLQLRSLSDPTP